MSIPPKLILYPRKQLSEECRRFFRERPSFLVQLGAKRPKGAPSACKHIPVPKRILDACLKPFFRGARLVPLFPQRLKFQQAPLHYSLAKIFLGLEVVVNVAYRNMGGFGDVRQARLPETFPV